MTGALAVLIWLVLVWWVVGVIRKRRTSIVPQRGMSVGADVGRLRDMPRVQVAEVTVLGSDRAHVVLHPVDATHSGDLRVDDGFDIWLADRDPALDQLREWRDDQSVLGMATSVDSNIVRLRCIDDLQPVTLRRLDS